MNNNKISRAVELLKAGELVAFPTETVYGLGADASNPDAVKKIFLAKGRPADHPVIVHIGDISQLKSWAKSIPDIAYVLADKFWPGPMTLILPVADHVSPMITGGQNSIGIRMPRHPMARELLLAFGGGLAAPSANKFGRISPTTAQHVKEELGDSVAMILDGGPCELGLESTIIDLTSDIPRILRPGPLSAEQINSIVKLKLSQPENNIPRVSGSLEAHYAPRTPIQLLELAELKNIISKSNKKIAVMSFQEQGKLISGKNFIWKKMANKPDQYAHDLYATLRELDNAGVDIILLEIPPKTADWLAIHDRLRRAAVGSGI